MSQNFYTSGTFLPEPPIPAMSNRTTLTLLSILGISVPAFAQTPETPIVEPKASTSLLTEQQIAAVTKQLEELEKTIANLRGNTLGSALERLRKGAASDAAALALYAECEKEVNIERKELSREEERRQKEQMERQAERNKETKDEDENGDFGTAVRLQLQYLILSLEASNAKDVGPLLPKLRTYVQDVVTNAEKLKGRAGGYLSGGGGGGRRGGGGGGGNPIISALRLERYLTAENWSASPTSFQQIWSSTILPYVAEKKPEELAAQWDACVSAEVAYRQGTMPAPEFEIWKTEELPMLRWRSLQYLYANAPEKIKTLGAMLELIKSIPGHPSAVSWLQEFRTLVTPAPAGEPAEKPAI
jgi:hypothetical protein